MNNSSKDNPNNNPNQVADPAELNADDLELLNHGVLTQVTGGRFYTNSTQLGIRPG